MNVVPFKAEHLLHLQLQMSQRGIAPFVTAAYAKVLENEFAFTAMVGDQVIMVGGVTKIHEHRGVAWSLVDKAAGSHFVALHKAVKDFLAFIPYRRIEAETSCDFAPGHRWLRMLGFTMEAERMRSFQVNGDDSALYARVR